MKLTNYDRGYVSEFDCVIHGAIYMTRNEYDKVVQFLYRSIQDDFYTALLYRDLARRIHIKNGFRVNVRVPNTAKIVRKFGLTNYKLGNFMLEVKN